MNPTAMAVQPRQLRPYQIEAVEAFQRDWNDGILRVGIELPTGAGKSTVLGKGISDAYEEGGRIAVIAHRAELLHQIKRDMLAVNPDIPEEHIGFVVAEEDDHTAPIVFATLQTLANSKRVHALGERTHIFWDEVHHAPAVGYHATFRELGGYDGAKMCGVSATMYRAETTKNKRTQIGLGDVIEKISYSKDLRWAIEQGYLIKPKGLTVRVEALNALNKIKNVGGDFNQGQLAEIMEAAVEYTVDAVEMHASDRRSIIFAASVEACNQITALINERGKLRAASITGKYGYDERKPVYQAFRDGAIDCIVTVMVLTEGADFPMCDCVVLARPTRSRILYSQMVGRSLRLYEGKEDALVLDLSGTTRQMKLIHLAELVHGMGLEIEEVDESGEPITVPVCPNTGEPTNSCLCPSCVEERTPVGRVRVKREGVVDMVIIDLLAEEGSDTLWLETPGGIPFISLDDRERQGWVVALWPRDGELTSAEWTVGSLNTRHPKAGGYCETDVHGEPVYWSKATAAKVAEKWITDQRFTLPRKSAPGRLRNQAPSDLQLNLARRLGIPSYEGMTKGRLSDEISIAFAAARLDGE